MGENRKKLDEVNYLTLRMKRTLDKIAATKDACNIELFDR